jgi:hypothetical protein
MSSPTTEVHNVRSAALGDTFARPIHVLSKAWLAVRVGGWLCMLPLLVKIHSLPGLLDRLSRKGSGISDNPKSMASLTLALFCKGKRKQDRKVEELLKETSGMVKATGIVLRVCELRFFRLPIFPRPCLRRSLALYRTLNDMGYPVEFHLGVCKKAGKVRAHSWVTFEGKPVSDNTAIDIYKIVYSYPTNTNSNGGSYEKEASSAAAGQGQEVSFSRSEKAVART